jgi:hypothetical protein
LWLLRAEFRRASLELAQTPGWDESVYIRPPDTDFAFGAQDFRPCIDISLASKMAPAIPNGLRAIPNALAWAHVGGFFQHRGLLFIIVGVLLGVWAAKHVYHARRNRSGQRLPTATRQEVTKEKHDDHRPLFSDLPPPLRSVINSGTLAAAVNPASDILPSNPPLQFVSSARPWRRHSYPSPDDSDTPVAEIACDQTSYYPIVDDDGSREPGIWRRRTLVFEMPPAPLQTVAQDPNLAKAHKSTLGYGGITPNINSLAHIQTAFRGLGNLATDTDVE